jgi:hypothetical protein
MSDYISRHERLRRIGEVLLRGVYLYLDTYDTPVAGEEQSGEDNHRVAVEGWEPQSATGPRFQQPMRSGRGRRREARN